LAAIRAEQASGLQSLSSFGDDCLDDAVDVSAQKALFAMLRRGIGFAFE